MGGSKEMGWGRGVWGVSQVARYVSLEILVRTLELLLEVGPFPWVRTALCEIC